MVQSSIVKPGAGALSGNVTDAQRANALLKQAAQNFHLVSPATACAVLPEGCSLAFSSMQVSVAAQTYDVGGGKVALGKSALDRIAAAAGVSWLPGHSHRLDDGSDPRYAAFVAVGTVRMFDGSSLTIHGTKEMDLRDGSQVAMTAKPGDLAMQRKHILAQAETKARLRAIRSLGLRSSYAPPELAKAFVVARLFFSGATKDPVLKRLFAAKLADSMLGSARAAFGPEAAAKLEAQSAARRALLPPPALGMSVLDDEEDDGAVQLGEPVGVPVTVETPAPKSDPTSNGVGNPVDGRQL